jgi:hypothetical protein
VSGGIDRKVVEVGFGVAGGALGAADEREAASDVGGESSREFVIESFYFSTEACE